MARILIANDDGIYGIGLAPLIRELERLADVCVVVPDSERSAASHSITLHKPFRVQKFPLELAKNRVKHVYAANGTPADCVRFGILKVWKNKKVDLIVGGVNHGLNLGEDVVYSGTVAVAREGAMLDIPSMAVSVPHGASNATFQKSAEVAASIAKLILKNRLPPRVFLNVNVPDIKSKKVYCDVTRLGRRVYGRDIPMGVDPRGHEYYWLAGDIPRGIPEVGTDIAAIHAGKVSVTPLAVDSTCNSFLAELSGSLMGVPNRTVR